MPKDAHSRPGTIRKPTRGGARMVYYPLPSSAIPARARSISSAFVPATALLAAAVLQLSGCATTTQGGAVGADRKQLLLVSSEDMDKMAAQSYTKLRNDAASKGALNTDPVLTKRVQAVAARIEPQTKVFRPDAPGWKWEVNVVSSDELNAFCMPGGKIVFYSGLITRLNLTDDEIAIVMGHEIAHALREHSRVKLSQAMAEQTTIG